MSWQAAQDRLAANHHQHHRGRAESLHLLAGRRRDAGGEAMVPSHARKGAVRYRYYVARGVGLDGKRLRLPAAPIEAVVLAGLRSIAAPRPAPLDDAALIAAELEGVTVQPGHLVVQPTGDRPTLSLPFAHQPQQRRQAIVVPPGREGDRLRAMKAEDRTRILSGIASGRT